jgi:exopolysaccharide production protein ExoZ
MRKIPPMLLLDAWRGAAALWVVMYHACLPFLTASGNRRFLGFPIFAISVWGQLGVVMFFVISGYCIAGAAYATLASGRSAARYGFDRIRRIYPPYLAACATALALDFFTGLAQSHHLLPPSNHLHEYYQALHQPQFWLANMLIMQAQLHQPTLLLVAWSLSYEIAFYALVGVLLLLARAWVHQRPGATGTSVLQIGISGLSFTSLAWLVVSPYTCPFPLDRWYQFGLGALLFLAFTAKTNFSVWNTRGQLVLAGILTLLFGVQHDLSVGPAGLAHEFILGRPSTRFQAATCVIFVIVLWALRPFDTHLAQRAVLRPLMWFGTISYSVYLSHIMVIGFMDAGGRRLGFDREWYWVTWLIEVAVAIVTGWLFYLVIERRFISLRQKRRVNVELSQQIGVAPNGEIIG